MDFIFFGLVFILMSVMSPTVLSLGVLVMSLLLSFSMLEIFSSWFCFVLFLLYIGGMMVIILYFSTLIPNQNMGVNKFAFFGGLIVSLYLIYLFLSGVDLFSLSFSMVDSVILYEGGNMYMSVGLLIFLFVLMVLVVVVTSFFGAPLRPMK